MFSELQNGASIFDFPENIESMTLVVQREAANNNLRAHFDFIIIEGATGKIMWHKGKIIYKRKYEAMFYHLIKFKTVCKNFKVINSMPDTICFSPTSIYTKNIGG